MRVIKAAVIAAAALAVGARPALATPTRVAFADGFTSPTPGTATGRNFFDEFTNTDDPQAKPSPITHFHLQLPPGTVIDTGAVARCGASDVELMLAGPGACPAASKLGTELLKIDTGAPGAARFVIADVTFLNNREQIILVSQDRSSGARVISRGAIGRDTEDFDIPSLPGTPPDAGAVKREDGGLRPVGAYTTTPPSCPAGGAWTFTGTWTFKDGSRRTVTSDYPCVPRAASTFNPRSPRRRRHPGPRRHRPKHHAHVPRFAG